MLTINKATKSGEEVDVTKLSKADAYELSADLYMLAYDVLTPHASEATKMILMAGLMAVKREFHEALVESKGGERNESPTEKS